MADTNGKSGAEMGHGGLFRWVWIAGVILVVYVLSVGPAYKLHEKGILSVRVVECLYAPLEVTYDLPFVADFFDWYVGKVWGVK